MVLEGLSLFLLTVASMRCFAKYEQNFGEGRAKLRTVYPLLYDGKRNAVKRKRSGVRMKGASSKNILFLTHDSITIEPIFWSTSVAHSITINPLIFYFIKDNIVAFVAIKPFGGVLWLSVINRIIA